jgi:hypothetical protein
MVRNIEAALGGGAPHAMHSTQSKTAPQSAQSKKEASKKVKSGGKVARVAEGIR